MAYGFSCRYCGHQETAHRLPLTEEECAHIHGYRRSILTCPGFEYSLRDFRDVALQHQDDPAPGVNLPQEIWKLIQVNDSHLEGLESLGRQATAWAGFIGVRKLQNAQARAEELREMYQSPSADKASIEREMDTLRSKFGRHFDYSFT